MTAARSLAIGSTVLALLAALAVLAALVTGYASRTLFDSEQFANRATAALDDAAVRTEIASRVTNDLVLAADRDLLGVQPIIEDVVAGIVGSGAFQPLFRAGVLDLHRTVFDRDADTVTLTIADLGAAARGALAALRPKLARKVPGAEPVELLEADPPKVLVDAVQLAEDVRHLASILLGLAILLAFAALALTPDRRRTTLYLGVAVAACGVVATVVYGLGRSLALEAIAETSERDAAGAIWNAYLGDLRVAFLILAGSGAVVAAAASSVLRPVAVREPLRRGWEAIVTTPERRSMRALRGALLLAAGIAIVARRDAILELALVALGVYVAYAGAAELMRLAIGERDGERAPASALPTRRTLNVAAFATLAIVGAATLFVGLGGVDEDEPPVASSGCNGSAALCDRPLDEIALAATHNAMSAPYPDFLFALQEATIDKQLADGVRALLIDAHYGARTPSGTVKTDLSEIGGSSERETYVEALGPQALDAALRIRDRLTGDAGEGERGVYFCHRFCELGAVSAGKLLGEVRDFLAANPNEVIVLVIEDYVDPEEIAAAVASSGLIDYVWMGPVGPPWPTPREMIESGGRALVMAENDAGDVSWYHQAYELVQETPFSFKRAEELTARKRIPASCKPNRGPDDATVFLINHWVDTSPLGRPTNATKVNDRKALLRRVRACERIRGLTANLIGVDFYREGEVFDAVAKLNADRETTP